ncbi:MAG: DUF3828 domain-containing protein [Rhizobiales bacterium]|nr:DUF3828 domain-containing protein [Hyphomicrobiales bacterium]
MRASAFAVLIASLFAASLGAQAQPAPATATPPPAAARARPAEEPLAIVRALYVADGSSNKRPYSRRLAKLHAAAEKNSRKIESPVSGLDFDVVVSGQDVETGYLKTLKLAETKRADKTAQVKANFKNFKPVEVVYDLVVEDGRWKIDEISSPGKTGYMWSKLLQKGASEK